MQPSMRTVSHIGDGEASELHNISQAGSNNACRETLMTTAVLRVQFLGSHRHERFFTEANQRLF